MTERRPSDDRATLTFPELPRGSSSASASSSSSAPRPGTGLRQLRTNSHSPVADRLPTRNPPPRPHERRQTPIQASQDRIRSALFHNGATAVPPPHSNETSSLADHELVRLENPRPNILRATNNYVTIPAGGGPGPSHPEPTTSAGNPTGQPTSSSNKSRAESRTHSSKSGRSNRRTRSGRNPHFNANSDSEKVLLSFDKPTPAKNLSSPFDFDRAKVHASSSSNARYVPEKTGLAPHSPPTELSGLGEIRPLVRNGAGRTSSHRPFRDNSVVLPQRTSSLAVNRATSDNVISQEPVSLRRNGSLSIGTRLAVAPPGSGLSQSAPSTLLSTSTTSPSGDRRCPDCRKCRCSACRTPRVLPSYWFCDNACLCSAESVIDTLSCMCCVRGCLYHCYRTLRDWSAEDPSDDHSGPGGRREEAAIDLSDEALCRCGGEEDSSSMESCARWTCLGMGCLCIPCLWCYLPMKACAELCNYCYARYHYRGCRCPSTRTSDFWGTHLSPGSSSLRPRPIVTQPTSRLGRQNFRNGGASNGIQMPTSQEDEKLQSKLKLLEQQ